jgi:hypothetical protein
MRKKLELRRGAANKEIQNLAIESKSVVDFKVPEIPIKKIQEIYKSTDLLRSKSDSDIISQRSQGKNEKSKDKLKSNHSEKSSSRTKNTDDSKPAHSLYAVCDEENESSEKSDYSAVHSYKTKSSSEEIPTQKSVTLEDQEIKRSSSQSSNISEEIPSEAYSIKSQKEQIKTAKISDTISSKTISERIECSSSENLSKKGLKESSNIEEEIVADSADDVSMIFTRKLDHIHLHNKELNDDIHNLENDLKKLTKLMSNFSKKSDDKNSKSVENTETLKSIEKSTSKDISEELPVSKMVASINDIDEDLQARVKTILSDVIPETDDLVTSIEEFDTRGKNTTQESSKGIEKSIASECIHKSTITEEILTYLPSHSENLEGLSAANHKNGESYISEVISTAVDDDKENTSPNESHYLIHKISKSSDGAISNSIGTEYSEIQKSDSKHVQEDQIDKSAELNGSKEISSNIVISLKNERDRLVLDKLQTSVRDKLTDTEISTAEDISVDEEISLKIDDVETSDNQIYTPINVGYAKTNNSIDSNIKADHVVSLKSNEKQVAKNQLYTEIVDKCMESKISIVEDIPTDEIISLNANEKEVVEDEIYTTKEEKCSEIKISTIEEVDKALLKENVDMSNSLVNKAVPTNKEWGMSNSFNFQCADDKGSKLSRLPSNLGSDLKCHKHDDGNEISALEDSAMFIPKGESTNIQETFVLRLDDSSESRIGICSDEFNDILEIIERETKNDDVIIPTSKIEVADEENVSQVDIKIKSPINCDVVLTIKTNEEESESIEEDIENKDETSASENMVCSELIHDEDFPRLQIGVNIEVIDAEDETSVKDEKARISTIKESNGEDRLSSDREQLDNLIEVTEDKLETVEKLSSFDEKPAGDECVKPIKDLPKTHVQAFMHRAFKIIRDPEYEDISEESLEVSEILDKTESRSNHKTKKFTTIPEKYISKSKSDEVLRILDDISNKSSSHFKKENRDAQLHGISCDFKTPLSELQHSDENGPLTSTPVELIDYEVTSLQSDKEADELEALPKDEAAIDAEAKPAIDVEDAQDKEDSPKLATDSSETGALDTSLGVSEIEMNSPREGNEDSRLDVEVLDDDLLSGNELLLRSHEIEAKPEFRTTAMGASSEKDIKAMIDKLKGSNCAHPRAFIFFI